MGAVELGNERGGSHPLATTFCVLLCLLAFYVLSVGPVLKVVMKGTGPPPRIFVTMYQPLEDLYESSPVVHSFLDWYLLDVWKVK
jgi:hypothetical protein